MKKTAKALIFSMVLGLALPGCALNEINDELQNKPEDIGDTGSVNSGSGDSGRGSSSVNSSKPAEEPFDMDKVSDEYLVGYYYFTGDFLEYAPTVLVKYRYDGTIEADFEHTLTNGERYTDTVRFDLSEEQYRNVESAINLRRLYNLDPEEANPETTCDGGYSNLVIYGKDGNPYKVCGGFCPHNRDFQDMLGAAHRNLPEEFYEYCDHYKKCWQREAEFVPYYGDPGNTYIQTTYGVFLDYDGDLADLPDYDYLVIDAQYHDAREIMDHNSGWKKYTYSYLNIGSIEDFRDYYEDFADITLGDYENWEGEKWVDVSDKRWQQFILKELAPSLLEKGVTGFFVDNCDVYYQYPTEEILEGLTVIMEGLKGMGCEVIINGGDAFLEAYEENGGDWRRIITGINQECVHTSIDWENDEMTPASEEDFEYFTDYIEKYADEGALIFLIEYAPEIPANRPLRYQIRYYSEEHGFLYYISESTDLTYNAE